MPAPLPIACTLTSVAAVERAREWRELAAAALLEKTSIEGGVRLVFRRDGEVQTKLRELVAAERECCPFLHLDLHRSGDTIVLEVTGPPEAAPIIAAFAAG